MIIFRIIFNLFHLVTRSGFRLLWFPIYLVTSNLYLCLVIVLIVVVWAVAHDPGAPKSEPKRQVHSSQRGGVPIIEPVTRREDGDSAFSTDLYAVMSDEERTAYSQAFYSALESQPDGDTLTWNSANINGVIRPTDTFQNNSGVRCRHFGELLKVHEVEQRLTGIGCAKGDGSWCKLRPNATPACGLGHQPGMLEGVERAVNNLF